MWTQRGRTALLRFKSTSAKNEAIMTLDRSKVSSHQVAILRLNDPSSKVNTLSASLSKEFAAMVDTIEKDSEIKSVVLISDKPGCFIAGADIAQLQACTTEAELKTLSSEGQKLLGRVADSSKPYVAAVNGSCLGGGMEVALACQYRIAAEAPKTTFGLPEVMLGLLPGAGGTQR